jgi:hypothetical protein
VASYRKHDSRRTLFDTWLEIPVHPKDMLGYHPVTMFIRIIRHHKQQIET